MSTVAKTIFGSTAKDSKVVDTTASQFKGLRDQFANALSGQLANPNQYQGPYTAQLGGSEQLGLRNVENAANQVGSGSAGNAALAAQAGGAMNPYAGLSGLEQYGIHQIAGQAFGQNPLQNAANQVLGQNLSGIMNPYAQTVGLGAGEQMGLGQIQQLIGQPNALHDTTQQALQNIAGGQNPLTNALIQSAQAPILNNFSQQALQQRGLYTGAGQRVQGQGSSPFAQASAQLVGNVGQQLNDAALGVTNQAFQQQLQGLGLAQQQPGMDLQNLLAGTNALGLPRQVQQAGLNNQATAFNQMQQNQFTAAGQANQSQNDALQRALAGLGAAGTGQVRQGTAYENAANRQLQAGSALSGADLANQTAALQAQLQNLQAQGLPRMVQQQGIDAGLAQFNTQNQQLQQLLQLLGGVTNAGSATTAGTQASTGLAGAFLSGFSDRRLKKDIQYAGTTKNGTKLYRFRYMHEGVEVEPRIGVMADEVEHIPGAVTKNELGLSKVDYMKVAAYG